MELKSQGINHLYSRRIPPPSNYDSFSERGRREDIGHIQHDFYRDHHQHHLHPHPLPPLHPLDMRKAIEMEIEKERIREELIMHEIERRLHLEDKARRDPMVERELALQRGGDGFPFFSTPKMEFKSPTGPPLAHGRSLEERIAISLEEKIRLNGRFQRGAACLRISEPFNAKRDECVSGLKRKGPGVDAASELLQNHMSKKLKRSEWK